MASETRRPPARTGAGWTDLILTCALVALCAAVVAGFAWTRPTRVAAILKYTQTGQLAYGGTTRPGSVYGPNGLNTGEPIYTNAVSQVHMAYSYRFESVSAARLAGTEQLMATVDNGQGITRTIALQPSTPFTGRTFSAGGTLDLANLTSVTKAFEQASGGFGDTSYTVSISPSVVARGTLGKTKVDANFDQPVQFTFNGTSLAPVPANAGATTPPGVETGQSAASGGHSPQLAATSSGSVKVPGGRPATIFLGLPVSKARLWSLVAFGIALFLGLLRGLPLIRRATSDDEDVRITTRHGSSLVEVDSLPGGPQVAVVELSSFEGVMRVARQLECPILHQGADYHVYAVVDSGTLYWYSSGESGQAVDLHFGGLPAEDDGVSLGSLDTQSGDVGECTEAALFGLHQLSASNNGGAVTSDS
jgi:hypothetical protein